MLKSIEITNYALIQHVKLDLHEGLTAITGETGSGKSIVMGALGLLLGERVDNKSMLQSDTKCIIEATFDLQKIALHPFFDAHDLDHETHTTIRREITPAGKSRSFINDTPVSISTLKEFGDQVIDIHSQHENHLLTERSFRYMLVDAFNEDKDIFDRYSDVFTSHQRQLREIANLESQLAQLLKEQDYRLFQLQELEQIRLDQLDQTQLENERDELSHADTILHALQQCTQALDDDPTAALSSLRAVRSILQKVSSYSTKLISFDERLQSIYLELNELSAELSDYADHVQGNPDRLENIQQTLSSLYQLQQKHRVQTVSELQTLEAELRSQTNSTQAIEEQLQELQTAFAQTQAQLWQLGEQLTTNRNRSVVLAAQEIETWFTALGLEEARIQFVLKTAGEYHKYGADEMDWLFSANKGVALQPLHKVASGGEISRVMLAIKATLSQRRSLPILILDEIDQGVSGEVGKKIGQVLKAMSSQMQLLTITHLAQIAGQANHHLKVVKQIADGQTRTTVAPLSEEERIEELAEMISGKTKSQAALANARELLN